MSEVYKGELQDNLGNAFYPHTEADIVFTSDKRNVQEVLDGKADILKVSRTVYVSESGNDETGDGTQNNPWRSIQKAIDNVPVINGNQEYSISVSAGKYSGFIAKSVSATITLAGEIFIADSRMYPVEIDNSNIKINGNENIFNIRSDDFGALFYIHNGGKINAYKTIFKLRGNGDGIGINIVSDSGFSQNSNISFDYIGTAISVLTNSMFYADGLYGNDVGIGIHVEAGGRVAYDTNNIHAEIPSETASGGRIYTGAQE